ncbi:hypothetical protein [Aliiroseovarius marinus]|uniref:hypothetical protein n=1 Tax=Aliiroseovarius marinus TaxID=2500159 RepID=UPI003D7ED207
MKKIIFAAALVAATAACNSGQTDQTREKANAAASARVMATLNTSLKPVLADCLTMLSGGAPVTQARMASYGYEKSTFGYRKRLGDRTIDRINMTELSASFGKKNNSCNVTSSSYASLHQVGEIVRQTLREQGFKPAGGKRGRELFRKNGVTIIGGVSQYNHLVTVSLSTR